MRFLPEFFFLRNSMELCLESLYIHVFSSNSMVFLTNIYQDLKSMFKLKDKIHENYIKTSR